MAGGNCCGSELLHIQLPNGSPISSLRLSAGSTSLATLAGIAMVHTERYLSAAFDRSAFETARRLRVHPGKRIRRTVDRLDPQGMPRSYRGVRRTPSAPCAADGLL